METIRPVFRWLLGGISLIIGLILLYVPASFHKLGFYSVIGVCFLTTLACFSHGRLSHVCNRLNGVIVFLAVSSYFLYAIWALPWWGPPGQGSVIGAGLLLCTVGLAGMAYAWRLPEQVFFIGYEVALEIEACSVVGRVECFVRAANRVQAAVSAYEELREAGWVITRCWQSPVLLTYINCRADPLMLKRRCYAFEHGEYYDLDTWEEAEQAAVVDMQWHKLFA